jgi:hypothetical protein
MFYLTRPGIYRFESSPDPGSPNLLSWLNGEISPRPNGHVMSCRERHLVDGTGSSGNRWGIRDRVVGELPQGCLESREIVLVARPEKLSWSSVQQCNIRTA